MQSPEFEPIKQAAKRVGRHPNHLRRLCETSLVSRGLAKKMKSATGQPCWHIARSFNLPDRHVTAPPGPADLESFLRLPGKQRITVADRAGVVLQWRDELKAADARGMSHIKATAVFQKRLWSEEKRRLSRSTLFNWDQQLRKNGYASLIDRRSIPAREPEAEPTTPAQLSLPASDAKQDEVLLTIRIHASRRITIDPT